MSNFLTHTIFREANDDQTSKNDLYNLAFSTDEIIRASIASNKNTSRKTLKILQNDKSEMVLSSLTKRYENIPLSKTIKLRLISVDDAEFILKLRTDEKYNKHISKISSDLKDQYNFINLYKKNETNADEFYFIIEKIDGVRCGTVRLYNFTDHSFEWGSWILNENKTRYAAIETAILVYRYAFNVLGFKKSIFEVNRENIKVVSFHQKTGAKLINEDQVNFYFEMSKKTAFSFIECFSKKLDILIK